MEILGLRHHSNDPAALADQRQHAVADGSGARNELQNRLLDGRKARIYETKGCHFLKSGNQVVSGHQAPLQKKFSEKPERGITGSLFRGYFFHYLVGDAFSFDECLA